MKNKALYSVIATLVLMSSAHASELKECQAKIDSILSHVKTEIAKGPAGSDEQYRMNADKTCGVEFLADKGHLTVTRFDGTELKKFETILLNEAELTSNGRVRATLGCEIDGDSVTYQTRLPIFSDGVRTPFQTKSLTVSLANNRIWVYLSSRVLLLESKIQCAMEF